MTGRRDVVLVTGASQGLGAAIARAFYYAGNRVALGGITVDAVEATARSLDPWGKTARALPLDVRNKEDFRNAVESLTDWDGIDVLVNNAAVANMTPVMKITGDEFDEVLAVNLRGPFFGCQVVGEHMCRRRYGRIVNIASQAGQMGGTVTGAHYAASKAGLILLTKYFAREFARDGVTVNAISPGALDTPTARSTVPADRLQAVEAAIPVGHLGSPDEVATIVRLLASRQTSYVTGATWDVNGGMFMR